MSNSNRMSQFLQRVSRKTEEEEEEEEISPDIQYFQRTCLRKTIQPRRNNNNNNSRESANRSTLLLRKSSLSRKSSFKKFAISPELESNSYHSPKSLTRPTPPQSLNISSTPCKMEPMRKSKTLPASLANSGSNVEHIVQEFESCFMSPRSNMESGSGNFVKRIVAAFEEKYKSKNDTRTDRVGDKLKDSKIHRHSCSNICQSLHFASVEISNCFDDFSYKSSSKEALKVEYRNTVPLKVADQIVHQHREEKSSPIYPRNDRYHEADHCQMDSGTNHYVQMSPKSDQYSSVVPTIDHYHPRGPIIDSHHLRNPLIGSYHPGGSMIYSHHPRDPMIDPYHPRGPVIDPYHPRNPVIDPYPKDSIINPHHQSDPIIDPYQQKDPTINYYHPGYQIDPIIDSYYPRDQTDPMIDAYHQRDDHYLPKIDHYLPMDHIQRDSHNQERNPQVDQYLDRKSLQSEDQDSTLKRKERAPIIIGAFLKKPVKVEEVSVNWIPFPGKKIPRKKSLKKLLSTLSGKKLNEKKKEAFLSQVNVNEENRELPDSGYDEQSLSSSSLTSITSSQEVTLREQRMRERIYANSCAVGNCSTMPNFNHRKSTNLSTFQSHSTLVNDPLINQDGADHKKIFLYEIPREEVKVDLGPCYPSPSKIMVKSLDRKCQTKTKNSLPALPKHPMSSRIPKHPFISLSKDELHDPIVDDDYYDDDDDDEVVLRNARESFHSTDYEYDVPRKYLSRSEPGIPDVIKFSFDFGLHEMSTYDVPKLRPKSSVYEDALSLKRRNADFVNASGSSQDYYSSPSPPQYATIKSRNKRYLSPEVFRSADELRSVCTKVTSF